MTYYAKTLAAASISVSTDDESILINNSPSEISAALLASSVFQHLWGTGTVQVSTDPQGSNVIARLDPAVILGGYQKPAGGIPKTDLASAVQASLGSADTAAQGLTATAVKTANYTAAPGDLIPCDATNAAFTVTLPTAPADKTRIAAKKVDATGNAVTISRGGSSDVFNKAGGSTSLTLTLQNQAVSLQYQASTGIWYVVSDDLPLGVIDRRYGVQPLIADTFTNYSTPPTVLASGQTMSYLGWPSAVRSPSAAAISGGGLDAVGTDGAVYCEVSTGQTVSHMRASFTINNSAGSTNTGSITLVSWADGGVVSGGPGISRTGMHLAVSATNAAFWVRNTVSGALTSIWSVTFATALSFNTVYTVDVWRSGNTAYMLLPDGKFYTLTDSRINSPDTYAVVEAFYNAPTTDYRWKIIDFGADNLLPLSLLTLLQVAKNLPTYGTSVTYGTVTLGSAQTITTTAAQIGTLGATAVAGPTGGILWEIEVPVLQTTGDGAVGAGSIWLSISPTNVQARGAWQQWNGIIVRKILETGLIAGKSYARTATIFKDTGGTGTSTVAASRPCYFTGTPV